jgi:hypothetical protein
MINNDNNLLQDILVMLTFVTGTKFRLLTFHETQQCYLNNYIHYHVQLFIKEKRKYPSAND